MIKKLPDPEKQRLRMAGLCSRSEQCTSDIRMKLRKAGLNSAQTDDIIRYLEDLKFLSDRRYAKAFATDKVRFSSWGRHKIRTHLAAKRIPSEFISEAMEKIDAKEYAEALDKAARAKAGNLDLKEREDKMKLYRHLISRGFESGLISRKITELINESSDL